MVKKSFCYTILLLGTLLAIVCFSGCTQNDNTNQVGCSKETAVPLTKEEADRIHALTFEAADELNKNSDIGNALLKVADETKEYAVTHNQWGEPVLPAPEVIVVRENAIDGYVGIYPYNTTRKYLTNLDIYSEKCHVLGLRVGDDMSSAGHTLGKFGYVLIENEEYNQAYYDYEGLAVEQYKKHDIVVRVRATRTDPLIKTISIYVDDCAKPPIDLYEEY